MVLIINILLLLLCLFFGILFIYAVFFDKPPSYKSIPQQSPRSSVVPPSPTPPFVAKPPITGFPNSNRTLVRFGNEIFAQQEVSGDDLLCLYRSIGNQMNDKKGTDYSVQDIMSIAKKHIVDDPNNHFSTFLTPEMYYQLRHTVGKKNQMQGPEVALALAEEFKTPIRIYGIQTQGVTSYKGPPFQTISPIYSNYDTTTQPLTITYDQYGKHYESLHPPPPGSAVAPIQKV